MSCLLIIEASFVLLLLDAQAAVVAVDEIRKRLRFRVLVGEEFFLERGTVGAPLGGFDDTTGLDTCSDSHTKNISHIFSLVSKPYARLNVGC